MWIFSGQPLYWPDAPDFAGFLEEGRMAGHAPGYPLFFILAKGFMMLGLSAAAACQAVSMTGFLAGTAALYALLRNWAEPARAALLAGTAALSWPMLLLAQAGTSHATDLLWVTLVLAATCNLIRNPQRNYSAPLLFAATLVLCGSMRATTLFMAAPIGFILLATPWRKSLVFWSTIAAAAVVLLLSQVHVANQFGGWEGYQADIQRLSLENKHSSVFYAGPNIYTFFNAARAGLWFALLNAGWLILPWLCWRCRRQFPDADNQDIYCLLAACGVVAGTLAVNMLYLSVHPGYLVPTLPAMVLAVGIVWRYADTKLLRWFPSMAAACLLTSLLLQGISRPIAEPRNMTAAAANALVLQYSYAGMREGVWKALWMWLDDAGLHDEVPEHRRKDMKPR